MLYVFLVYSNMRFMNYKKFLVLEETNKTVDDIISTIESYDKKIKINKPYTIYDNGLETAISNSEITRFYAKYQREKYRKYIKSIPFPFDKMEDNMERFEKLNTLCKIYQKYTDDVKLLLVKSIALHIMDIILYDMYFDIESRYYNVYDLVDKLSIPDANNDKECVEYAKWITDKENPLNYVLFYTNTNNIITTIRNNF